MSWLRSSPLRKSFSRQRSPQVLDQATDCDPRACYDSFCKHWQQAYEIILKSQLDVSRPPTHDDVLGVVSHLDHVVTLLLLEVHHGSRLSLAPLPQPALAGTQTTHPGIAEAGGGLYNAPCLEHLLSENLLDKLYEWGTCTGRYSNAVKLEQLKLYELLVSHSRQHLLVHEPFVRPLLKLLGSCQGEIFPRDVEARLVVLLNQLCVSLMQNVHLLDLFFFTPQDHGTTNFVIFSLLIPFVHREGPVGHQARDALLLCMALSKKNTNIGVYIARHSNVCPVLATGLSGLYSLLPRSLDVRAADWHRLTPDDVNDIPELPLFMNSLEFCNAVAQVAHPMIKQQLLDFLYQGFLVPVMGPALLQQSPPGFPQPQPSTPLPSSSSSSPLASLQTGLDEQVAATVYFDLVLRSVTEPGLLQSLIRFLLEDNYDGARILDVLVQRIDTEDRLCLVSLALFETLVDLNCEDVMLELVYKYLLPGDHLISDVRNSTRLCSLDPYGVGVDKLLALSPVIVRDGNSLGGLQKPTILNIPNDGHKSMPASWNHYGLHTGESLYSNYHAYLCDARQRISSCQAATERWTNNYDNTHRQTEESCDISETINEPSPLFKTNITSNSTSNGCHSNNDNILSIVNEFVTEASQLSLLSNDEQALMDVINAARSNDAENSLQSLGDSSGYESFMYKPEDGNCYESLKLSNADPLTEEQKEMYADRMFSSGQHGNLSRECLGPFLTIIFCRLHHMPDNSVYVNLHLTGLVSRLCIFPHDLSRSLLLCAHVQTRPPVRSLYQILQSLKQRLDTGLSLRSAEVQLVMDNARSYLIERESRLVNARKNAIEASVQIRGDKAVGAGSTQFDANYRSLQTNNRSSLASQYSTSNYDPFKRSEPKRKSLSSSISSMFRRTSLSVATSSLSALYGRWSGSTSSMPQPSIDEHAQTFVDPMQSSAGLFWANEIIHNDNDISGPHILANTNGAPNTLPGSTESLHNLVMCAVILDEWLKELAAILQEHTIAGINSTVRGV